jgi:hypothetical protein
MKTEVFAVLVPIVLSREELISDAKQRECLKEVATGARELLAGGEGKRNLALMRFESSAESAGAAECLSRAFRFDKVVVEGATDAYGDEDTLLVAIPGLLFYGSMSDVKGALVGTVSGGAWPSELALGDDQYLACRGTSGPDTRGTCALTVTPNQLLFLVRLDLPNEDAAKVGAGVLRNITRAAGANAALRGFSYEQKGARLDVAFEARGGAAEQAQQIGVVSALAIHGVRKYLQNAKQGEARTNVARIAKAYAMRSTPPKKLTSLPAVPKSVPSGMKYQSAPEEWKAWQPIGFAIEGPQYYQYEIVAAPNGTSAEIIARGDLDADGQPSKFVLRARLVDGVVELDERMDEIAPEE